MRSKFGARVALTEVDRQIPVRERASALFMPVKDHVKLGIRAIGTSF